MSRERYGKEDDGHTIADMSQLETPSLWGRRPARGKGEDRGPEGGPQAPYPEMPYSPGEKRLFVFAALKAALLIGFAFLLGLGLVIAGLLGLWHLFA